MLTAAPLHFSLSDSESKEQIIESFKSLAGGLDFVTESQLRFVFQDENLQYMLQSMPKKEGVEGGYDYGLCDRHHTLFLSTSY